MTHTQYLIVGLFAGAIIMLFMAIAFNIALPTGSPIPAEIDRATTEGQIIEQLVDENNALVAERDDLRRWVVELLQEQMTDEDNDEIMLPMIPELIMVEPPDIAPEP